MKTRPRSEGTMSDYVPTSPVARRSFLARLGAGVSVAGVSLVAGAPDAAAQAATGAARVQPARHTQDDWMDSLPGKHRFVIVTRRDDRAVLRRRTRVCEQLLHGE